MALSPSMRGPLPVILAIFLSEAAGEPGQPDEPMYWTVGSWDGVRRDAEDGTEAPLGVLVQKRRPTNGARLKGSRWPPTAIPL